MTKLTTTLALINEHYPCKNGLNTLLDYLGEDYPEDKEINLLTILESNGIDHFFWALRATEQDGEIAKRISVQLAAAFAERVLHIFEDKYPDDNRPRKAIESAKDYLNATTEQERKTAAAKAEAWKTKAEEAWEAESEAESAAGATAWAAWAAGGAGATSLAATGVTASRAAQTAAWAASAAAISARAARKEEQHAQILIIKSLLAD